MSDAHLLVFCTAGTLEQGEALARAVVERKLAACVNVVPRIVSVYRWQGEVERAEETLLLIKTRAERFEALREALVALHAYSVPEVIGVPVERGHAPYLEWLDAAVAP